MTQPQHPNPTRALLGLPEFRAFLVARGLAALGTTAIATVVAFQTNEVTGEPLALGLLGLVEAIPALGLMLVGGHVADRRDRRSIILVAGSLLALGSLALALLSRDPAQTSFLGILIVIFLIGVASAFQRPALAAFETQVIPIEHATRGASLSAATWTAAGIMGPAAGGLAIAFIGIPATYLTVTLFLALSVLVVLRIAPKPMPAPQQREGTVRSLVGGIRYVVGDQLLLSSMALDLFAVFFGGAVALLPIFASDILGVGPFGLGLLRTAPSVGALLSMLATTRFPPRQHAGALLLGFVALFGVSMVVFGLSTSFVLSLGALFVAGLADGVSVVIRMVILRVESPEQLRGRIASVNHIFIGASNQLGAFESGVLATLIGVVPSVLAGGVLTVGVVAIVAGLAPRLRRLDLAERLIKGPGAQPMATATIGTNIAAAEVDPTLEPALDAVDQLARPDR